MKNKARYRHQRHKTKSAAEIASMMAARDRLMARRAAREQVELGHERPGVGVAVDGGIPSEAVIPLGVDGGGKEVVEPVELEKSEAVPAVPAVDVGGGGVMERCALEERIRAEGEARLKELMGAVGGEAPVEEVKEERSSGRRKAPERGERAQLDDERGRQLLDELWEMRDGLSPSDRMKVRLELLGYLGVPKAKPVDVQKSSEREDIVVRIKNY